MIHAYDELYVNSAQHNLGRMLDYGVNTLHIPCGQLFSMFLFTGYAERFGQGECSLLVGKSGIELCWEVLDKLLIAHPDTCINQDLNRSREYWAGWAIAYLQWFTNISFADIEKYITIDAVLELYNPYHEMDVQQFVDKALSIYAEKRPATNLKLLREKLGYSQSELAKLTGIPVRTIQQYEQRQKNINNAKAEYILRMSKCLFCNMEDILEAV